MADIIRAIFLLVVTLASLAGCGFVVLRVLP